MSWSSNISKGGSADRVGATTSTQFTLSVERSTLYPVDVLSLLNHAIDKSVTMLDEASSKVIIASPSIKTGGLLASEDQ